MDPKIVNALLINLTKIVIPANTGAPASKLSTRSRTPPCPKDYQNLQISQTLEETSTSHQQLQKTVAKVRHSRIGTSKDKRKYPDINTPDSPPATPNHTPSQVLRGRIEGHKFATPFRFPAKISQVSTEQTGCYHQRAEDCS